MNDKLLSLLLALGVGIIVALLLPNVPAMETVSFWRYAAAIMVLVLANK